MPCVINLAKYFARKRAYAKLIQIFYKVQNIKEKKKNY